jgi:hypothetical protein
MSLSCRAARRQMRGELAKLPGYTCAVPGSARPCGGLLPGWCTAFGCCSARLCSMQGSFSAAAPWRGRVVGSFWGLRQSRCGWLLERCDAWVQLLGI